MSATVKSLGLYDLLAPQFLAGFQFPDYIDKYLSLLAVAEFITTSDDDAVLYTGTVFFPSSPGQPPVLQHRAPSGEVFDFHDLTLRFRLRVPRAGSAKVASVIDAVAGAASGLAGLKTTADDFGGDTAAPTDYPGIGFTLELLVTGLDFHLGSHWRPAVMNPDYSVTPDPNATSQDVRILLPQVLLRYSQGQDFSQAPKFELAAWGNPGFDAPSDLAEGELATMDPPLAIHTSGRVAFGLDEVVLDLSGNSTPPEILDHFGADASFRGVYIKALQLYYTDRDKDLAINVAVRDALISLSGEVSLEAEVDVMLADTPFEVSIKMYDGAKALPVDVGTKADHANTWSGGRATVPPGVVIYLQVTGGVPPLTYAVDFTPAGGGTTQHLWDASHRQAKFPTPPAASVSGTLTITVKDSSQTQQVYSNTLALTVAVKDAGSTTSAPAPGRAPAQWTPDARPAGIPGEDQIQFTPSTSGTQEILKIDGGASLPAVKLNGVAQTLGADRQVIVDVAPGAAAVQVEVDYGGGALPDTFPLYFDRDKPKGATAESVYVAATGTPLVPDPGDTQFQNADRVPLGTPGGGGRVGGDALRYWAQHALDTSQPITIHATASNEGHPEQAPHNQALSEWRGAVAQQILAGIGITNVTMNATGATNSTTSKWQDRVATVKGTAKTTPAYTLTGSLSRPASGPPAQPATRRPPSAPAPPVNRKPDVLRRLSLRLRLERNEPVLIELSGEIDFETSTEAALRNQMGTAAGSQHLGLQSHAAATRNPNPADGIVDFTLNVTWDPAARDLTETLTLGASPADKNGLVQMHNPGPNYNTLKNVLGAVLIFTPILSAAVKAADPASAGDWAPIAVDLGVPAAIGALGVLNTTQATLYGGELQLRQNVPSGSDPVKFTNAALTFDYSASFRIDVGALDIHSSQDAVVRYRAVGVNLHFGSPPKFEFVLDTSKGYSLDLGDPSLLHLPAGLGDLLKIAAARIARYNPLTLELDLEMKADLGIITVDKFLVKIPLDGSGLPMIVPSGIKVNIPGTLIGSGSVAVNQQGFEGTIDLTLVPVKLRVAASVGVEHVSQAQPPREATAFYLGLEVDFPAPIALGNTGLGLFGMFGLFGMHYAMKEAAPVAGDAVGPDLKWLIASGGAPYKLSNNGVTLWQPEIDHWAFGVGVVLGTMDGVLLNLRGAFILTLPGPRIIVTVNLKYITPISGLSPKGMDASQLDVGIIGILDLDFGAHQITLGVMVDFEIKKLLSIQIPVQLYFNLQDANDWHFWMGTIQTPAKAEILGIVHGSGYFMIGGEAIDHFPPNTNHSLPGVAVAMGVAASVLWGSESAGIYLKVAARADFGVSFNPHLFIEGEVTLTGELRLVVISISADGKFLLQAPDPVYLKVHVCGSVSLLFFSISACVDFAIGNPLPPAPPPPLIAGMYLQSYAPVIASGQGGERPIDASLGDAVLSAAAGLPGLSAASGDGPVVPIDSVPVLQFQFGADVSAMGQTFTEPLKACVTYPGAPGVSLGGKRHAQYKLKDLKIDPPLAGGAKPPVAWRKNKPAGDPAQTQVDLAMFSRNPQVTNSAIERSTELTQQQTAIWGDACAPVAPPVCVFWCFCGQRLGPSPSGWTLIGLPSPDPPGTKRSTPVETTLVVEQPAWEPADGLLMGLGLALGGHGLLPARIFGVDQPPKARTANYFCRRAVELPELPAALPPVKLTPGQPPTPLQAAAQRLQALLASERWLRFHTGAATRVRMLLAIRATVVMGGGDFATVSKPASPLPNVLIRERDAQGTVLRETDLSGLNPKAVTQASDLPSEWTAAHGPWTAITAAAVATLAAPERTTVLIDFVPKPATTVIEVAYTGPAGLPPSVLVGALETCSAQDAARHANEVAVKASTIQQIQSYLDGGSPVPLLAPNTTYTITADYDVTVTEADGSTKDYNGVSQAYRFTTEKNLPARLDPWVLCTAPAQHESCVFYEDPVDIVFNDKSAIQLVNQLGYQLGYDLRAADGLPEPPGTPVTTVSLQVIDGVGPAAYDAMRQTASEMPCVGSTSQYQNQKFTAPVQLRPLMGYTLDLVTDPAAPAPTAGKPVTPLFRRSFKTSRYPTLQAFAADLGATRIRHRALKQPLNLSASGRVTLSDHEIQQAFLDAGEQALPAPTANAIVIYWAQKSAHGPYVPAAILVDTIEPVWRTREEPSFATPVASDPSFKVVTIAPQPALEMVERNGSAIAGYVSSPGGARTVALFAAGFTPAANGTPVTLALHRPASATYGTAEVTQDIFSLPVAPQAPWEQDDV